MPDYDMINVTGPVSVQLATDGELKVRGRNTRDACLILLMGVTGSGKSTFVECIGNGRHLRISKNQLDGVTQELLVYRLNNVFRVGGDPVYLMDTPGFADDKFPESKVLRLVQTFMKENRSKTLDIFKALTGLTTERNITIVTTMWDQIWNQKQQEMANQRLQDLQNDTWQSLVEDGTTVVKFENNHASAIEALRKCMDSFTNKHFVLERMLWDNVTIRNTTAGSLLYNNLLERRIELQQRLQCIEEELNNSSQQLEPTDFDPFVKEVLLQEREDVLDVVQAVEEEIKTLNHNFGSQESRVNAQGPKLAPTIDQMIAPTSAGSQLKGLDMYIDSEILVIHDSTPNSSAPFHSPSPGLPMDNIQWLKTLGPVSVKIAHEELKSHNTYNACLILLTGATGTGKSTFIECVGNGSVLGISKDQLHGFTQELTVYRIRNVCSAADSPIYLMDTPGFADSKYPEAQVLRMVQSFMKENKIGSIKRVLHFDRITDRRMTNTRGGILDLLKALTGVATEKNITIVTTMWDQLWTERQRVAANERLADLQNSHWKGLLEGGTNIVKFENNHQSALRIVQQCMSTFTPQKFILERMILENVPITNTTAGSLLYRNLLERRVRLQQRLQYLDAESKGVNEECDLAIAQVIEEERAEIIALAQIVEEEIDIMGSSFHLQSESEEEMSRRDTAAAHTQAASDQQMSAKSALGGKLKGILLVLGRFGRIRTIMSVKGNKH
ncbi:hypothetical protein CVT24_013386 [Panaeolus cyanescens]|uniref:G domain-containing protein n=1 Tax=Panaeolus cyanescens TaxID=181874 RepID=A0A409YMK4_9AGAR|nr:hypothetical protein CVT24_013386 [Panaeolus cyanescens]